MQQRWKVIYGEREMIRAEDMVLIDHTEPVISIYNYRDQPCLAIYGRLLCAMEPSDSIRVKLTTKADMFSVEQDVINFIKQGTMDDRLPQQIEIFNTAKLYAKHGTTLERLIREIRSKVVAGDRQFSISCVPEVTLALKNYVAKTYSPRQVRENKSTLDILI